MFCTAARRPPRDEDVVRKGRRASAIARLYVTQKTREYYKEVERKVRAGVLASDTVALPQDDDAAAALVMGQGASDSVVWACVRACLCVFCV